MDEELHQKSVNENKPFFPHVTISLKISFIICIIGFLLLSVIVYTKQEKDINDIILYISVGLISISVLITGISPIFLNNLEYVERDIDGNIKEKL